ncbi:hypothetical protein Pcinc_023605 [Petrolisthes cinctipes]|uniref:C2H2-type domain-containing protein n=1 Tax=Petrolisthes cinctipes TaxID=88211 RepID=A0AAE1FC71_PETCI|nr:hypothetical protein Pcinc_023605 [Petrolisthes cinctipes]
MSRRVTSKEDIASVISLYKAKHKVSEIVSVTGVCKRSVQRLLKNFKENGEAFSPVPGAKTGRPKLISRKTDSVPKRLQEVIKRKGNTTTVPISEDPDDPEDISLKRVEHGQGKKRRLQESESTENVNDRDIPKSPVMKEEFIDDESPVVKEEFIEDESLIVKEEFTEDESLTVKEEVNEVPLCPSVKVEAVEHNWDLDVFLTQKVKMETEVEVDPLEVSCSQTPEDIGGITTPNGTHTLPLSEIIMENNSNQCPVCQKIFMWRSSLRRHLRDHSRERRPYTCDICFKIFPHEASLSNHKLSHTGEMMYECDICLKGFFRSDIFTSHILKHKGISRYKCDVCNIGFSRSDSFMKHKETHAVEEPYKCEKLSNPPPTLRNFRKQNPNQDTVNSIKCCNALCNTPDSSVL